MASKVSNALIQWKPSEFRSQCHDVNEATVVESAFAKYEQQSPKNNFKFVIENVAVKMWNNILVNEASHPAMVRCSLTST